MRSLRNYLENLDEVVREIPDTKKILVILITTLELLVVVLIGSMEALVLGTEIVVETRFWILLKPSRL